MADHTSPGQAFAISSAASVSVYDGSGNGQNGNFIERLFKQFESATVKGNGGGNVSLSAHLDETIAALGTGDSSDPQKLARYQKAVMMFTVHSNAQSSMVKSIADLDKSIIRDFN